MVVWEGERATARVLEISREIKSEREREIIVKKNIKHRFLWKLFLVLVCDAIFMG